MKNLSLNSKIILMQVIVLFLFASTLFVAITLNSFLPVGVFAIVLVAFILTVSTLEN